MSLTSAKLSEEVWLTCCSHALTNEKEEIMGLLFGDLEVKGGNVVALIWGASPQVRIDRRKDRVETSPEQLAAAAEQAERMSLEIGKKTRVIGWYHSHPHITVLPSDVDLRTQANFQLMDAGFIGLIFSCFAQKVGKIQVIAFQSLDGRQRHPPPVNNYSVVDLDSSSSDYLFSRISTPAENFEHDTADSRVTKGKQKMKVQALLPYNAESIRDPTPGTDSSDISETMKEALHRSKMEVSAAAYVRKEVRFEVVPASDILKLAHPLVSFTDMQNVLFKEEQSAYKTAIEKQTSDGNIHPLTAINHSAVYQASLCKLQEYCVSPVINTLQDRLAENRIRLAVLTEEAKSLERLIQESGEAPRRPYGVYRGGNAATGQANIHPPTNSTYARTYARSAGGTGSRKEA